VDLSLEKRPNLEEREKITKWKAKPIIKEDVNIINTLLTTVHLINKLTKTE